ncbi:MAG TPA: hypothetical protein VJ377_06195 [Dehalococcoidales bacterium]|nr:MAG: hypothetical protein A2Z05_04865 [Chloroflexi bacterium RBG_16_60_22]HJX13104.1 hypothetical protein [Dehalococcoidales bacterium]
MAKSKYEKYVLRNPYKSVFKLESVSAHDNELNCGLILAYQPVAEAFVMPPQTHSHDFYQVLCFLGGNPLDVREFDAEIELAMGQEGEIITIDSPSVVTIPPGVYHCPLNFKRIGKPIVFMEIMLTGGYQRTYTDGTPGVSYDQEIKAKKPRK